MKELPEHYIVPTEKDFEVTIKNGEPRYKNISGMTERTRRTGGPLMAIVKAMIVFSLTGFVCMIVLLFLPDSWPDNVRETTMVVCIVIMLGAPIVTLALHLRRRWLRWTLLGFVGAIVLVGGLLELTQHLIVLSL